MTLQDAINRAQSDYPDIIDSSAGLFEVPELQAVGIPTWNRRNRDRNRSAVLEIRTFKGISTNAIHYYGRIVVDGVYVATLGDIETPRNLTSEQLESYPLFGYKYTLIVKRPVTQQEIDSNPDRWYAYSVGSFTEGYESLSELIEDVKEIFKLRFTGLWDFYVLYPRGNREKLTI